MIIGIDGKPLTTPFPCGLKRYAQELLTRLAKIDKKNTYIIFLPKPISFLLPPNFIFRTGSNLLPWQVQLPFLVSREKVDVFHFLQQHGSIFFRHAKTVSTIHDLASQALYPRWHENLFYSLLGRYVNLVRGRILATSLAFIAVSKATRKELVELGIKQPIYVVPEAASGFFHPITQVKTKNNYILAMADFSPRKNILRTLAAYAALPTNFQNKYQLRIVISMAVPEELIKDAARRFGITEKVILERRPNDRRLRKLYSRATIFVYPSLYEGFGLPILEAMATGCPVITSDRGAMKEVAGDAAYLVDPRSSSEISLAMQKIVTQPALAAKLQKAGLARAKQFFWEQTARKTLAVYKSVSMS